MVVSGTLFHLISSIFLHRLTKQWQNYCCIIWKEVLSPLIINLCPHCSTSLSEGLSLSVSYRVRALVVQYLLYPPCSAQRCPLPLGMKRVRCRIEIDLHVVTWNFTSKAIFLNPQVEACAGRHMTSDETGKIAKQQPSSMSSCDGTVASENQQHKSGDVDLWSCLAGNWWRKSNFWSQLSNN